MPFPESITRTRYVTPIQGFPAPQSAAITCQPGPGRIVFCFCAAALSAHSSAAAASDANTHASALRGAQSSDQVREHARGSAAHEWRTLAPRLFIGFSLPHA